MLIRFGSWLINPEEIEAVMTISPYILRVQMTSGKAYDLTCKDAAEQIREREKILRGIELRFPPRLIVMSWIPLSKRPPAKFGTTSGP